MDWKDIAKPIAKAAPVLATVLGGPVGAVASAAGMLLSSVLGVESTPVAVDEALKSNPDLLLKIKEIEATERAALLEWQSVQLQAEVDNVRSARDREVALARAGHGGAWVTGLVALVVIIGFFWMLSCVISSPTPPGDAALLLLGSLGTGFGAVVNYYLGSSLGSFRKDTFANQDKLKR